MLRFTGQGVASDICVGAIAQLVGSVVFTPVDVIKERMQVRWVFTSLLEMVRWVFASLLEECRTVSGGGWRCDSSM